ncbi:MAG TPA: BadF/BadG/BcrA/BcrD ATPase family protein, partial [Microlunatus sp.]|nr:BadF/BadG/BcrA/BcrD ATPase family protein [Microlunatus sp.]
GVVVAAGTGTVCLGIDQTGRTAVVDGVGHWAGDEGSAFDLGRSGLRLAARHLDGRASAPLVSECAHRLLVDDHRLGPDLAAALRRLGRVADRVQLTAGFARQVIDCARAGEPAAAALVDRAAAALSDTVAACCARLDPPADGRRIACVGGVFEAGDLVAEPFAAALERVLGPALDGWRIVPAEGTVLDGVVRLACRPTDLHASLQHLQDGPR